MGAPRREAGGDMDDYVVHPDYFNIESHDQPLTPMEALMRSGVGHEPDESILEMAARREALSAQLEGAMAELTELEREIITAIVIEHVPLRQLAHRVRREDGTQYGKTWIAHLRDEALAKLRAHLTQNKHAEHVNPVPEGELLAS